MKNNNKELAYKMIMEKKHNPYITYSDISEKTGYSKRQLMRMFKETNKKKDMEALIHHGNEGREPINKASNLEIEYLRKLKEPYPNITL